jgi:OOP family OmpA-OmpF porin
MSLIAKFKKLTGLAQGLIVLGLIAVVYFGYPFVLGLIPKPVKESKVVAVNDLPPLSYDKTSNAPRLPFPSDQPSDQVGGEIRAALMGWNAQSGVFYANGGPVTTQGSLMEQEGVKLRIQVQNNCYTQAELLYAFAADYAAGNANTGKGVHFTAWMGDGVPGLISGLNEKIKKELGEEYIAQVFFAGGASFGEDKFLGPPAAKRDPQLLRGALVAGVILDGDWNIAMKYCSDNGVPVNNDPTTYDPNAVNWLGVDDYIKASQYYVNGQREKRPIVINGKRTGRDTTVVVNSVVTWTPGDVVAVQQKGGLVSLASTKDYSAQMPNAWIGIKKWMEDNPKKVTSFIKAASLGGDQVKSHGSALAFAATISEKVYADDAMKAADWEKYFKGFSYTDAQGNIVELGGSRVFNLADNAVYFGLDGGLNKYEQVYKTFGDIAVQAYPERLPSYPAYEEVVNLSFLTQVYSENKNNANMTVASTPKFTENATMSELVSAKSVTIEFRTASAEISPASAKELEQILSSVTIAENLLVTIEGHTDSQGNDDTNLSLSQARAEAVRQWLVTKGGQAFKNKITAVGYGETQPKGDNATPYGRAINRRVEVKLGR